MLYNIYIDESCHLEHDKSPVMCIGYTKVDSENYFKFKEEIKAIKLKFKNPTEIKWNNVSASRLPLYFALVDYFFENDIEFRCILVKYKLELNHEQYNKGSHDTFYYKLVYFLLKSPTNPLTNKYKVFIDVKDTRGRDYVTNIKKYLNIHSQENLPFNDFQHIHSHESVFLQIADLFIGAITFKSRGLVESANASESKIKLISYIESKLGNPIDCGTEPTSIKFNVFDHHSKDSAK
jgi:hypothetical protein